MTTAPETFTSATGTYPLSAVTPGMQSALLNALDNGDKVPAGYPLHCRSELERHGLIYPNHLGQLTDAGRALAWQLDRQPGQELAAAQARINKLETEKEDLGSELATALARITALEDALRAAGRIMDRVGPDAGGLDMAPEGALAQIRRVLATVAPY